MPIVRIKDNHQLRISLKYVSAKEQPPKNGGGMEYLYTLSSGDVMFLPAMAHQEIQALRPAKEEPFLLCKMIGQGGAATWAVERINAGVGIGGEMPGAPLRKHVSGPDGRFDSGTPASPKPVTAARSISGSTVAPPPSLTTRESIRIFNQLVATIQAVKAAEEFSKTINRPVVFSSEDIRAMGISGFIEQSRRAA